MKCGTFLSILLSFVCGVSSIARANIVGDGKSATQGIDINAAQVVDDTRLNSTMKVALLLKMVDPLVTGYSFMYANEILNEVLKLDPQNTKARILTAMISPAMKMRGIWSRDQFRLSQSSPAAQSEFNKSLQSNDPNGGYRLFFNDNRGLSVFHSEADYQSWIHSINLTVVRARQTLAAMRGASFPITLYSGGRVPGRLDMTCDSYRLGRLHFRKGACEGETIRDVVMDRADIEYIYFNMTFMDLFTVMADAYRLDGVMQVTELDTFGKGLRDRDFYELLRGIPQFGMLKTTNQLRRAMEIGPDLITALQFLGPYGNRECQNTIGGNPDQRAGNFIGDAGFCLFNDYSASDPNAFPPSKMVALMQSMITGKTYEFVYVKTVDENGTTKKYNTKLDLNAMFMRPSQSLKGILPTKFNVCGKSMGQLTDGTYLGLFPNGDYNRYESFLGNYSAKCTMGQ